jgi:hypothetical protein
MQTESRERQIAKTSLIVKHFFAAVLAGNCGLLLIMVFFLFPEYMSILYLPDKRAQPMGWTILMMIGLLVALSYLLAVVIGNTVQAMVVSDGSWKTMAVHMGKIILLIIGVYFLQSCSMIEALLSPGMMRMILSPVGSMFFGG